MEVEYLDMARELKETAPTADEVEDWLHYPNAWKLVKLVKQDAEINAAVVNATEKIFAGHTKEELNDLQRKDQIGRAGESVRRIMERINAEDNDAQGNDILFFSAGRPHTSLSQDEHYKLETTGENNLVRNTLLYVVIYRLAVLNLLGFTLNEDNQIAENAVYRGTWKNREGTEFDLSEYRSPKRPHVLLQIFKPRLRTDRFSSVLERLAVRPF